MKNLELNELNQASFHLDKEMSALSLLNPSKYIEERLINRFLRFLCKIGAFDINEFRMITDEAKENKYNSLVPLKYLIDAKLSQDQKYQKEYSAKSEKAFLQYWGYVPPFARNLLMRLKGWSSLPREIEIENWIEWQIDYSSLPNKVVSQKDGRIMRLIKPGIQWDKDGKEIWLYPFYIDETPLKMDTVEKHLGNECAIINSASLEDTVSLDPHTIEIIAQKIDKRIPTQTELYAAYLQIEQNIEAERWHSFGETEEGMFKRIKNIIETSA